MTSFVERALSAPAGEILSFRAFDYQLGDVSVPLSRRFAGRQVLVLSIGARAMKLGLVSYDLAGKAKLSAVSQLLEAKTAGALTDHLKAAVRQAGSKGVAVQPWIVVMIANTWTVEKVSTKFHGTDFERMVHLREAPEDVVGKPLPGDREYAVVPHPMLDSSLCFGLPHSIVLPVLEAVKAAGLRIARVQVPIIAMVEAFMKADPEGAQARDILAIDHQGILFLPVQNKEWVKQPRYRSTQPGELAFDLAKFLSERPDPTAPLTLLGSPTAALERIFEDQGRPSEIVAPFTDENPEFTAAVCCENAHFLAHDLNPDRPSPRPPLPKYGRVFVVGFYLVALALIGLIVANAVTAVARSRMRSGLESEKTAFEASASQADAQQAAFDKDAAKADEIAAWIRVGYHPQRFLMSILRAVPATVVLSNVEARLSEGICQMDLALTLDGPLEAQTNAVNSIEKVIYAQGIRVVHDEQSPAGGRAMVYRFTLILPAPGEATPL